jgi:acyl dehydratase
MTSNKQFNPDKHLIVPAKTFKQLAIGDIFRAPSRTLTDAHASAFQTVSCDNHPIHYDEVFAAKHGHAKPVVHGLQVLSFTAPGATLFPHYIGEAFIAFTELSCSFLKEVHSGDTLYSEMEIIHLTPADGKGLVETAVSVYNQNGELVLSGRHKYLLKN